MRPPLARRRSALALAALIAVLYAAGARAATLRGMVLLDGPQVRLSDLFDGTGTAGARVLGPAPPPGGRIVVEAAQAAAIARDFGLDWQPLSTADHAVLERPGVPVPRALVTDTLRAALHEAGADAEAEVQMTGFNPPMIPPDAHPDAQVTQLDWDHMSGRYTALLSVSTDGMDPVTLRISGRALPTTEVVVPVRRIAAGEVLTAADLRVARVRSSLVRQPVALSVAQAAGYAAQRGLMQDQPVLIAELEKPALVQRRGRVLIELHTPGIDLTAQGIALEGGAAGDHIRVLNPASRAVVDAEIVGDGRVRVIPGTTPVIPAGRGPQGYVP